MNNIDKHQPALYVSQTGYQSLNSSRLLIGQFENCNQSQPISSLGWNQSQPISSIGWNHSQPISSLWWNHSQPIISLGSKINLMMFSFFQWVQLIKNWISYKYSLSFQSTVRIFITLFWNGFLKSNLDDRAKAYN